MDNKISTVDRYADRIRSKMGVSEPYLPNEDINMPDILGVAELNIGAMFPVDIILGDDGLLYMESIVVLECCILLCSSMPARLPKKEAGPHASHELYINWDKKKEEFSNERDILLGRLEDLLNPDRVDNFRSFTATFPKRGW